MVGNKPNYNDFDVLRAFLLIDKDMSRIGLVKRLELGEGTVRTILDILKKKRLIESTQKGHSLSEKGKKLRPDIEIERIKFDLYPGKKKAGIYLKTKKNVNVVELRDIAVKNGADGALIFKYKNGLYLEGKRYKELETKGCDILIIAFADSYRDAENGALAAAGDVDNSIKRTLDS